MKFLLLLLALTPQILSAQKAYVSPEIEPLVAHIKQCHTSPVDYVMGLFEKYDVVVLGERDHMDTTQYEMIAQIISDPRFIDKVGHVFTEMGSYNMAARLTRMVQGNYPHDTVFNKVLVQVLFDFHYMPVWEKINYTQLCRDIYRVNKTLPMEQKISITPTDIPFSWNQTEGMTGKEFAPFYRVWPQKDIIMGHMCLNELYNIFDGPGLRKKVLVIYNTPHSCRYYKTPDYAKFFAYQVIADRFPGRVANVAINWATCDDSGYKSLSNGGKLDAAFAACGNKPVGFDIAGTPLSEYFFDFGTFPPEAQTKFSEVYHGFIFYKPVTEWVDAIGVPDLDKIDCKEELARRCGIYNDEDASSQEYKDGQYVYYTKLRSFPITMFFEEHTIKHQMEQYYRPAAEKGKKNGQK